MVYNRCMIDRIPVCPSPVTPQQAIQTPSLTLALLGDSVHTLWVRHCAMADGARKAAQIHTEVSRRVCAAAQAQALQDILDLLTPEEADVVRRARNTHVNTVAKHASVADYKSATAYEALIGYLYWTGAHDRLYEILQRQN